MWEISIDRNHECAIFIISCTAAAVKSCKARSNNGNSHLRRCSTCQHELCNILLCCFSLYSARCWWGCWSQLIFYDSFSFFLLFLLLLLPFTRSSFAAFMGSEDFSSNGKETWEEKKRENREIEDWGKNASLMSDAWQDPNGQYMGCGWGKLTNWLQWW